MKLINILLKEDKGLELVPILTRAIDQVDENLNYKDFAQAIALVIKNEYGTHNIGPFMDELHAYLGIQEEVQEGFQTMDLKDIAAELQKSHPKLKFYVNKQSDRIDVIGTDQDKLNFGDKMYGQTFGDYEVFHTDDEDRGEIVRLVKSSRIGRGK